MLDRRKMLQLIPKIQKNGDLGRPGLSGTVTNDNELDV